MIRRVGFVSILIAALIVSACGRQVTPNPPGIGPGGLQSGYMSVKFRVASAFNFQTDSYVIVFNTSNTSANQSSSVTPVAEAVNNNYAGYSIAIAVGGQNGSVQAQAYYYYRPCNTSQPPVLYPINATPQQLIFTPNSNGLGTEFTVVFSRNIADFSAVATSSPSPGATASPTSGPTATPTATPPSSNSCGVPVTQYWTYNFFTVQGPVTQFASASSLTIVDSLGQNGPTDATYESSVLNTATSLDQTFYTIAGTHPSTPDAITGGEIANAP